MTRTKTELLDSLAQSEANRKAVERRFGFIPYSVLTLKRGALSNKLYSYRGQTPARNVDLLADKSELSADMRATGWDGGSVFFARAGRGTTGLSVMAAEVPEFFIKYYAKPGQVYGNPYAGKGVEMQVAKLYGMHFYGYDIAEEFAAWNLALIGKIDDGKTTLSFTCGDSRHPDAIPNGILDFSFYSPPYWDIEDYGDEPGQLGKGKSYKEFLDGLQDVAHAWVPKFKRDCWHVVNVNDFRKDGRFYSYHSDVIARYALAGWELYDTWIINGVISGRPQAFAVKYNMERRAPKVHEYALVFRLPTR